MTRRFPALVAILSLATAVPAVAQNSKSRTIEALAKGDPAGERSFTIHPAKPPVPALSTRLLTPAGEQIPGDASPFYHRAIESLIRIKLMEENQAMKSRPAGEPPSDANVDVTVMEWLNESTKPIPTEEARELVRRRGFLFREMRLGGLRDSCDWGFQHRDEGFSLLLPDIQETRSLARWIALKVRLDLAEGKIDEALQELKSGLGLARNVAHSEFFIQSLVAGANANLMVDELERFVQHADAPSLYWALAALPSPFIDIARAGEFEGSMLKQEFPALRSVESEVWSIETAREFGDLLVTKLGDYSDKWPRASSPLTKPGTHDLTPHFSFLARIARAYPEARRSLPASGIPADRLDAMPMLQVVSLHSYRRFSTLRDDVLKWLSLPPSQADAGMERAEAAIQAETTGLPFAELLPGARSAYRATTRLERRLALLRTVEAVRLYAAAHDGALPPNLDALVDAPAPVDPATARPFVYTLTDDEAVLATGTEAPDFRFTIRAAR